MLFRLFLIRNVDNSTQSRCREVCCVLVECKHLYRVTVDVKMSLMTTVQVNEQTAFHVCHCTKTLVLYLLSCLLRGAFKKFCNSTIKRNGNVTNYTLFYNIITIEFNAFATFFWQTVNSTKIETFRLSLQPLLGSFLEHFIVRIVDRRSKISATLHDNVK